MGKDKLQTFRRSGGFSRFELAVTLGVLGIVLYALIGHFQGLLLQAERASFRQELGAIQSAVSLQMLKYVTKGDTKQLARMIGANPMDYLQDPPAQYIGILKPGEERQLQADHWGFDPVRNSLLYAARFTEEGELSDTLRLLSWRIQPLFADLNQNGRYDPGVDRLEAVFLARKKRD